MALNIVFVLLAVFVIFAFLIGLIVKLIRAMGRGINANMASSPMSATTTTTTTTSTTTSSKSWVGEFALRSLIGVVVAFGMSWGATKLWYQAMQPSPSGRDWSSRADAIFIGGLQVPWVEWAATWPMLIFSLLGVYIAAKPIPGRAGVDIRGWCSIFIGLSFFFWFGFFINGV